MRMTNKYSTRSTPKTKQLTIHRRARSVSPRKTRSLTPRKKTTSASTPRKDGGVQQTPTVNNLSRDKAGVPMSDDDIGMEESKTQSSSTADTEDYVSAQGSSTSDSEPIHIETQDNT